MSKRGLIPETPIATPTEPILNGLPNESEIIIAISLPVKVLSSFLIFSASLSGFSGNKAKFSSPLIFDLSMPALAHTNP